jgi:hypothetical protein
MSSKMMKVDEAVAHLKTRGVSISRRGLYGWIRNGVRGIRLEHCTVANPVLTAKNREVIVVTAQQLDSFLAAVGVRGCQ